ncbi:hypothetical protein CRG98_030623 [Punica granatum]|uniref:Uncharacterized protein n=1 Tax=Punica granatum TaxID=22663 RepID=A0A2I0J023_PUNGR|nr:hypothetical protein CRG98_030623 [Punica granatum]
MDQRPEPSPSQCLIPEKPLGYFFLTKNQHCVAFNALPPSFSFFLLPCFLKAEPFSYLLPAPSAQPPHPKKFKPEPIRHEQHGVQHPQIHGSNAHTQPVHATRVQFGVLPRVTVPTRVVSKWRMTWIRMCETRLDNHPGSSTGPTAISRLLNPLGIRRFGRTRPPALMSLHCINFDFGLSNLL